MPSRPSGTGRSPARAKKPHGGARRARKWSARVTRESDALDLESGVFRKRSAVEIARSLKQSAEQSQRRKAEPFRSAMSMLVFYINRAGHNLGARQRRVLEQAKDELRAQFGRPRQH